jgi:hypothetical protein
VTIDLASRLAKAIREAIGFLYTDNARHGEEHGERVRGVEETTVGTAPCEARPIETDENVSRVLFARPSFVEGVGRIFDFSGALSEYNRCETGERADCYALWADWCAVGNDIRRAAHEVMGSTR